MLRRFTFALGILLIAASVAWKLVIAPMNDYRFPAGWTWEMSTLGQTSYPDETGTFVEGTTLADDPINITVREVSATAGDVEGQVLIDDHIEVRSPVTNAVDWEYSSNAVVDAKTGIRTDTGDYYFLPRRVDRNKTYKLTNTSYESIEVSFQREEDVLGINTYLFAFYGDLNNVNGYPDQPLEEGQTIICFDFALEYWVEPATGEIMKYREWCEGDWVVDTATGEKLFPIGRWGGSNSGDDLIRQAGVIRSRLETTNMNELYIPLVFGVLGVGALAFGLFTTRQKVSA